MLDGMLRRTQFTFQDPRVFSKFQMHAEGRQGTSVDKWEINVQSQVMPASRQRKGANKLEGNCGQRQVDVGMNAFKGSRT